jgi:tetratricopeptide (TPR) repeat protein
MINIKTKQIAVIAGGILFTLVLLESALRLGGFIHLSIQEHRNLKAIKEKGEYRILCLGESTTMGQWPPFLEKILNKQDIGIKFAVIDKGLAGTNTSRILSDLESNLDKYQPDMVITMMGANDEGILHYKDVKNDNSVLFRNIKVYKFAKMIWMYVKNEFQNNVLHKKNLLKLPMETELNADKKNNPLNVGSLLKKAQKNVSENEDELMNLGQNFRGQGKYEEAETYFKKVIEVNPKNESAYIRLGWCFREQGKYEEAETYFKRAIEINPENDGAYSGLGLCFREQGKYEESESYFKRAIEVNPENDDAYSGLGWCFRDQDKHKEKTEIYFKRAIEINPKNTSAYMGLGWCYIDQGKYEEAEIYFKRAIEINPKNDGAYSGLDLCFRDQGKYEESESYFKRAIEINPKNDGAYRGLGKCYRDQGKYEEAETYFKRAIELNKIRGNRYFRPMTVNNYLKLKEILDRRDIKYVCVQYPMWDVELLKKIFEGQPDIIYVDNKKVFKEAVNKSNYCDYFIDILGGNAGHCTNKGNKLLAESIARVILKEYFNREEGDTPNFSKN